MDELEIRKRFSAAIGNGRLEDVQKLLHGHDITGLPDGGYTLLCKAVLEKHIDIAKLLITSGAAVTKTSPETHSNSPLHWASAHGNLDIVEMLLDRDAGVNAAGVDGKTPLHHAVEHRHVAVTKLLLERNADPSVRDKRYHTPLLAAAGKGCALIVELLLQYEVDVNIAGSKSMTSLHLAAECGSWHVTKLLLAKGASFNAKNDIDQTPLHVAAHKGHLAIVQMLVEAGASVSCECKSHFTPLHYASASRIPEIVEFLLNNGAKIEDNAMEPAGFIRRGHFYIMRRKHGSSNIPHIPLNKKFTPLHIASKLGHEKVIELLLLKGADVNAKTADDTTPLLIAIKRRLVSVMRLLLQKGSIIECTTALQAAVETGSLNVLQKILNHQPDISKANLILKSGGDVNVQDNKKKTVIFYAVEKSNEEMVRFLIKKKADVNIKDDTGKTPIFYASNFKISELLIKNNAEYNVQDDTGKNLIFSVVQLSNFKMVEFLIKNTEHLNSKDINGKTPLFYAVEKSNFDMTYLLVRNRASLNGKDSEERTAIYYSVINSNFRITELLLKNGAYVKNIPELLMIASERKCVEILRLLIDHGADVNDDIHGRTALHYAMCLPFHGFRNYDESLDSFDYEEHSEDKMGEIARLLLGWGANVDAQIVNGSIRALHFAAQGGWVQPVEALLQFNANVNCVTSIGYLDDVTPLHLCAYQGNAKICSMLLKAGAHVDVKNADGQTALHIACQRGKVDIVNVLLKSKANINAKISHAKRKNLDEVKACFLSEADELTDGKTPLHIACENNYSDIILALLKHGANVNVLAAGKTALYWTTRQDAKFLDALLDYGGDIEAEPSSIDGVLVSDSRRVLRQHVFKLNVASLHIPHHYLQLLYSTEVRGNLMNSPDYRFTCEEELARMMSEQIENTTVSFHDILTKHSNTVAKLLRNEDIMSAVKFSRFRAKYPVYVGLMLRQIQRGVEIKDQLEKAAQALQALFPQLPLACVENIMKYLSNSKLKVIVDNWNF